MDQDFGYDIFVRTCPNCVLIAAWAMVKASNIE